MKKIPDVPRVPPLGNLRLEKAAVSQALEPLRDAQEADVEQQAAVPKVQQRGLEVDHGVKVDVVVAKLVQDPRRRHGNGGAGVVQLVDQHAGAPLAEVGRLEAGQQFEEVGCVQLSSVRTVFQNLVEDRAAYPVFRVIQRRDDEFQVAVVSVLRSQRQQAVETIHKESMPTASHP